MSYLCKLCQRICFLGFHVGECRAFVVDGQQVGLVRPDVMKEILNYPQVSLYSFYPFPDYFPYIFSIPMYV